MILNRIFSTLTRAVASFTVEGINSVSESRQLGTDFSQDLKWNTHIDNSLKRAAKLIFCVVRLKHAGINSALLWSVYYALIRSVLTFSFLVFCNAAGYPISRLQKLERRVGRIIGSAAPCSVDAFCGNVCKKLAAKVAATVDHPLRDLLVTKPTCAHTLRNSYTILRPPLAKTSRYFNSFIKYFNDCASL